ncbi:hypothetical protein A0E43_01785 [Pectobacterium cacticida]
MKRNTILIFTVSAIILLAAAASDGGLKTVRNQFAITYDFLFIALPASLRLKSGENRYVR